MDKIDPTEFGLISTGDDMIFAHPVNADFSYQIYVGNYEYGERLPKFNVIFFNSKQPSHVFCGGFNCIKKAFRFIQYRFSIATTSLGQVEERFALCLKNNCLQKESRADGFGFFVNVGSRSLHIYTVLGADGWYVSSQQAEAGRSRGGVAIYCITLQEALDSGISYIERKVLQKKRAIESEKRRREDFAITVYCDRTKKQSEQKMPSGEAENFASMRINAISGIVALYGLAAGGADVPEANLQQGIKDLLSDLREYCRRKNIPFE